MIHAMHVWCPPPGDEMELSAQLVDGVAAHLPPAALVTLADAAPWAAAVLASRLRAVADTYRSDVEHTPETTCLMAFWVRYWRIPAELRVGVYPTPPVEGDGDDGEAEDEGPVRGSLMERSAWAGDLARCERLCQTGYKFAWFEAEHAFEFALGRGHVPVCRWLAENHVLRMSLLDLSVYVKTCVSKGDVQDLRWLLSCGAKISGSGKFHALQVALDLGHVDMVACLLEHATVVELLGQAAIQFKGAEPRPAAVMLQGAASACRRDVCELVLQWARPLPVARLCPSIESIVSCDNRHDVRWFLRQPYTQLFQYNLHPAEAWVAAFTLAATLPGLWRCAWVARWYGITRAMLEGVRFLPLCAAAEHGHAETVKWMVDHFGLGGAAVPVDVVVAAARRPDIPLCEWLSDHLRVSTHFLGPPGVAVRLLHALVEAQCLPACVWAVQRWALTAADVHAACQGPDGAVMEAWLSEWCSQDDA